MYYYGTICRGMQIKNGIAGVVFHFYNRIVRI